MNLKPTVSIIFGTRPEAIKLAPIINQFEACKELNTSIILTGQHMEMLNQVQNLFQFKVDKNFKLMTKNQSLSLITTKALNSIDEEFKKNQTDLVLVQGDTTTAFTAALGAFYNNIPVGHIEAGLRTNNIKEPFPEEVNRRMISQLATLHFAPTNNSMKNLLNEKVNGFIYNTGNTIVDAINLIKKDLHQPKFINFDWLKSKIILLTVHRRENLNGNLQNICKAVLKILEKFPDVYFLIPLHKNKLASEPIKKILGNHKNIFLVDPLNYEDILSAMKFAFIILTDSGGIQEEAPSFGKPVLILRNYTERTEAIENNTAKLIGTNIESIFDNTIKLINNKKIYNSMVKEKNPFGDGNASQRILKHCLEFLL